jgi:hypothetical protein
MPNFLDNIGGLSSSLPGVDLASKFPSAVDQFTGAAGKAFGSVPIKALGPDVPSIPDFATAKAGGDISTDGKMATVHVVGKGAQKDFRVRLSPQSKAVNQIYGPPGDDNILDPLRDTLGLMFPFTPAIGWSQAVNYKPTSLVHSNQDYQAYENTPSTSISVDGTFVIQNLKEAKYMLACIHFLRVVSKMYFGKASFKEPSSGEPSLAGMPPPVLSFSGYGSYMFNELPVIVKDHSYSFKPDVSYIDFEVNGEMIRLPSILDISIKLVVQNTPKRNKDEFDLDKFRTGELMKSKGWI